MSKLFISHSTKDDTFVRNLRAALADQGQDGWIDSRELRGGDPLWPEIRKAIGDASAFAVVVSPDALQSDAVSDELDFAVEVQQGRGKADFPIIPLLLDGTKIGAFKRIIGEEQVYISVSSEAGGVEAAIHAILVALGIVLPTDVPAVDQPRAEPLEELVLELSDLKFYEEEGRRRASALAELIYEPPGKEKVVSLDSWRFIAPLGPIEVEELQWYLEKYAIWPSIYFKDRAKKVEDNLIKWGQLLYQTAMPLAHTSNVMQAWARIDEHAGRRFSVFVKSKVESGSPAEREAEASECATLLLALPWELLYDDDSERFLFQGAKPTRVRRRLPNTRNFDVPVVSTPIRILLVTARPEDDACGYIDHRSSALPLVEAMESLPGLVKIHLLSPPTLPALREELERARDERKPYHVVHFDGHGVFDRTAGLGGLCFEAPEDIGKTEKRKHATIYTDKLGPLLRDHRIPLVFLEACQTAMAEKASGSVASELLKVGVASVVAMSHSVLVETARRFVGAFYKALAGGKRVGDAMLAGQRQLKDDTFRGRIFGAGELRLEDWFVPVLFQEKDDPQLFKTAPASQTKDDFQKALEVRLGELPPIPETGFVGRSRELLTLQRMLRWNSYVVIRGQGGEGKTALVTEFARWIVRSQQMTRSVFVSVETHSNVAAVLDAIGRQLVGQEYSIATFSNLEQATLPVEQILTEQSTLLVVDNMESILLSPFIEAPEALSEDARLELEAILKLCARLNKKGNTQLVFTSREALPAPFDALQQRQELHQLGREDAVKLVERVLNAAGGEMGGSNDAAREEIERLVDAVHGHARTLALLAPSLRSQGVEATRASLVELMVEMEKKFPGSREQSVFASVELSLRRLSETNHKRVRVLGVFHGVVDLDALVSMMGWEKVEVVSLAEELIGTGLATSDGYDHLTLNPALCPYLRGLIDAEEKDELTAQWTEAMRAYVVFLMKQSNTNAELVASLTLLELPNLIALLDRVHQAVDTVVTIDLATSLFRLLQNLGKPQLLERVGQVRDAAARALIDTWNHARFQAERTCIEQQLGGGHIREAVDNARVLHQRAQTAGEQAYADADYDIAVACFLFARVSQIAGRSEQALPLLDEARQRFEDVEKREPGRGAERMTSLCITERGDCLRDLGRLDEAAAAYDEGIQRDEQRSDIRSVAVGKGQLGTVRMFQHRYPDALEAHAEARKIFSMLNEPESIATSWHQTGMVYELSGEPEAAEDAYRKSLVIKVRLGNIRGQAHTLVQLGNLYDFALKRWEEAVAFYKQAAEKYTEIGDAAGEGRARGNLGGTLLKLNDLDEARKEIRRAIECDAAFGHASRPWQTWSILSRIEAAAGNPTAATEARGKAIVCYLAYRRDGGENHNTAGRLFYSVTQALYSGDSNGAVGLISEYRETWKDDKNPEADALDVIIAGSRDRTLADAVDLDYTIAAEILLLIEMLEKLE